MPTRARRIRTDLQDRASEAPGEQHRFLPGKDAVTEITQGAKLILWAAGWTQAIFRFSLQMVLLSQKHVAGIAGRS